MKAEVLIISTLLGYFIGCIQPAYLIGKYIKKIDIRKHGSNNAGASNATIVLGWKYGVIVALIDIFKATLAVLLVRNLFENHTNLNLIMYLTGASVIIGHNYPFYMAFRGGKGTASLIGMLLALDWRMALVGIATIVTITIVTDYIALGTIVMMLSFCISTALLNFGKGTLIISVALSALSIYNHLNNIRKIIKHEEKGLRNTIKK